MEPLGLVLVVLALVVFIAVPVGCRWALRRMGSSQGLRDFLNAYGPRFPIPGREKSDDGTDD